MNTVGVGCHVANAEVHRSAHAAPPQDRHVGHVLVLVEPPPQVTFGWLTMVAISHYRGILYVLYFSLAVQSILASVYRNDM